MAERGGVRRSLLAVAGVVAVAILLAFVALDSCGREQPPTPGGGGTPVDPGGAGSGGGTGTGGGVRPPKDPPDRAENPDPGGGGAVGRTRDFLVIVLAADEQGKVGPIRFLQGARVELRDPKGAVRQAVSGADGQAEFEGVPEGDVMVRASAEGCATSAWERTLADAATIALGRGVAIEGIVVDGDGAPVAGAETAATEHGHTDLRPLGVEETWWFGDFDWARAGDWPLRATADGAGRFRIEGARPGAQYLVVARSAALGAACVRAGAPALGEAGEDVRVVILPTGALECVVTDPEGKPVPGCVVLAIPADDPASISGAERGDVPRASIERIVIGRTGDDGRARLADLVAGPEYVAIAVRGELWFLERVQLLTPSAPSPPFRVVHAGTAANVRLRMRRGGNLLVRVLAPDGTTPPGAWSSVDRTVRELGRREDGPVDPHPEPLTPGAHVVRAGADGYPPVTIDVVVPEGETVEQEVRLARGIDWSVEVVAPEGRPVPDAEVVVRRVDATGFEESAARGTTGEDGSVLLAALRAGTHEIEAGAPGFARTRGEGRAGPGEPPGRIVLQRGGLVRGALSLSARISLLGRDLVARGPFTERVPVRGDGGFDVRLAAGRWSLELPGKPPVTVDVVEGAVHDVVFPDGD